jgi:anti-anti-sigma factor
MQRIAGPRPIEALAAIEPSVGTGASPVQAEPSSAAVGDNPLSRRRRGVLSIMFESARRVVTVRCLGRLVFGLESALFGAAVPHHRREIIIVDLSGVTAIDAAGIGALISLRATGSYLRLVNPSETARQVLRLTNLDSVFDISESECGKPAATPLELKDQLGPELELPRWSCGGV